MDAVLDMDTALERLEGDHDLLRELVQLFLEEVPDLTRTIHGAVEQRQAKALQQAAHSLKGAAANLSATAVAESAKRLEHMGRDNDFSQAPEALAALQTNLERLAEVLTTIA
ncbi:MAG: Hpt domain-containing protein [Deltaproteobacteria bacterium]|nr:Hpt domain-containing protein [Deltaproteobacteria bacterium]